MPDVLPWPVCEEEGTVAAAADLATQLGTTVTAVIGPSGRIMLAVHCTRVETGKVGLGRAFKPAPATIPPSHAGYKVIRWTSSS